MSQCQTPTEIYRKDRAKLFTRAFMSEPGGTGSNRFGLDSRKKFFSVRVVRFWQRSPRKVVDIPSLEVSKTRQNGAWSNLVIPVHEWGCPIPL